MRDEEHWTILVSVHAGYLRWKPLPVVMDTPGWGDEQAMHDADMAAIEESKRETANSAAFARWVPRLRRLGLIGPPRIPSLPTEEITE